MFGLQFESYDSVIKKALAETRKSLKEIQKELGIEPENSTWQYTETKVSIPLPWKKQSGKKLPKRRMPSIHRKQITRLKNKSM